MILRPLHDPMLAVADPDAFAAALVTETPPRPADQELILTANQAGTPLAAA